MKVLIVNKYHYYRGGAETCVLNLGKLLEDRGHKVMHFSMHHPKNIKYKYDKFFVPYIDFADELKSKGLSSKVKVLKNMIYSKVARRNFAKALDFFRPDVIHLHNIHRQITTSILYEAEKRNIPVVWTLHDYQIICPNYTLLSHGKICERCRHNYLAPLFQRCVKNSFQASLVSAFEKIINDIQKTDKKIALYLSPSKFLINKFAEFGIDRKKMFYLNNFFDASDKVAGGNQKEKYFLYMGRLSGEKGIATLCEAAKKSRIKLKIAGEGPLRHELQSKYASDKIEFVGYKTGKDLVKIRENAWFVVVPSEWYENNPFSIIEAFSEGVPVIGADIGGIPELIKENKTGFLFTPKSVNELADRIKKADKLTLKRRNNLGKTAREFIIKEYNSDKHYKQTILYYQKAINSKK